MAVKAVRELLRRNPQVPPERIGDVILAATAQVGDQGLTLGREVALLAGLPHTVPGLRRRPHVRRRADGDDGRRRGDRDGRGRPRHRRRRRAHGAPRDGRRGRVQPALRQRAADRRERRRDGTDGREPPRRLPAADEGGRRPVRGREPAARLRGVGRGRRRHGAHRRPDERLRRRGLAGRRPRRVPAARDDARGPRRAADAVPRRRPGHRGQLGRAHRRRHRRSARGRGASRPSSGSSPRCGSSASPTPASSRT